MEISVAIGNDGYCLWRCFSGALVILVDAVIVGENNTLVEAVAPLVGADAGGARKKSVSTALKRHHY